LDYQSFSILADSASARGLYSGASWTDCGLAALWPTDRNSRVPSRRIDSATVLSYFRFAELLAQLRRVTTRGWNPAGILATPSISGRQHV